MGNNNNLKSLYVNCLAIKRIAIKKIKKATSVAVLMLDLFKNVATKILNTKPELANGVAKLNLLTYSDDVKKYKPKKLKKQRETIAIKSIDETLIFDLTN